MATKIGTCPDTMDVTVPLFDSEHIQFVPWQLSANDSAWKLHCESFNITKPMQIKPLALNQLDDTYQLLDSRLSQQLHTVYIGINAIIDYINVPSSKIVLLHSALHTLQGSSTHRTQTKCTRWY